MIKELYCYAPNCRNIPLIQLDKNTSEIQFLCKDHHINKIYDLREFDINLNKLYFPNIKCILCSRTLSQNEYLIFCIDCRSLMDEKCYYKSMCYNSRHIITKTNLSEYLDKNKCLIHKNEYTYGCPECSISFCNKCQNAQDHIIKKQD